MAKSLFILFYFILFSLLHRKECEKVLHHKCHLVTSHDKSHDRYGKIVHRLCSSYISSIQKITETLLSFPCRLG